MIFVSSEFELTKDRIAVLTAFYPESVITNTSTVPITLYKSKDGTAWSVLTTLNPNQQTVITLDSGYPYITIKDNGTVYVNSKTPNYYHDSTGNNTGVTAEQLNQALNDTVVKTVPQSLTDTQMTQARDNINAVSQTQLEALQSLIEQSNSNSNTGGTNTGFIKQFAKGVIDLVNTPASGGTGNARYWTTTFPTAFSEIPFVIISPSTPNARIHYLSGVSPNEFTYSTNYVDNKATITWLAFTINPNGTVTAQADNQEIVQLKQRIAELSALVNAKATPEQITQAISSLKGNVSADKDTLEELANLINSGSSLPATTHTRLLPSQYLNLVGKKDLGDGMLIPVYEVATTTYGVSSFEHQNMTYKLLEEGTLDIIVNVYRQEGTGTLMPEGLLVTNDLNNAVEVSVRLVGANELSISLAHTGDYLSTQAGNTPVRGYINVFGVQLTESITIQYDLVNRNTLMESMRRYFTVESGTDYFNIAFDNWDLGGSQLPDGISYLDIQLHGIQFTKNTTMFGISGMSTSFYRLTSNELRNTAPVNNDAYTGSLTGITVTWDNASMHIPATQR